MSVAKHSIYPKVDVKAKYMRGLESAVLSLSTTLRKRNSTAKGNGNWYLWDFVKVYQVPNQKINTVASHVNQFHEDVYRCLILGEIDESLTNMDGDPIFERHGNQISEVSRLINSNSKKNG